MMPVPHEEAAKKVHPDARGFQAVTADGVFNKRIIGWAFLIPQDGSKISFDWVWMTDDHVVSSDRQRSLSAARRSLRDFVRSRRQGGNVVATRENTGTIVTGDSVSHDKER